MSQAKRQRGMALVVGLILLSLMTIMVITSFNIGRTSLDIVGNMQRRNEVATAANGVIQEAISTTRMFETPNAVILNPCSGPNTRCVDTNGDGTDDVTVTLAPAPTCVQSQVVPNAALDLNNMGDRSCVTQENLAKGIEGVSSGNSLCADSMWEINAVAVDAITEAQVTVAEGAAVRVSTDDIGITCPPV